MAAVYKHAAPLALPRENTAFVWLLRDRLQERASAAGLTSIKCLRTATMPGDDLHEGIDQGIGFWEKVLLHLVL